MPVPFPQSFEESNPNKKQAIERWLLSSVDNTQQKNQRPVCFVRNVSFYLTELPDTRKWQPEFKTRVLSAIVDRDMKEDLVKSGVINWCRNVRSLLPVSVPKDGNCLLHAVATAVWGVTDKSLLLRRILCLALSVDQGHRFHGRWMHHRQIQITQFVDRLLESGTELMKKEWTDIRQCLEPDHLHSVAIPHRFLESIHVYALANILRRPIIVLADPTIRSGTGSILQESDLGGIYLPLEWSWTDTCRTPILLGYSHSHFCPLVFADHSNHALVDPAPKRDLAPLVNGQFQQFPVKFLLQGEEPEAGQLLRKYLKVRETVMLVNESVLNILCAELEMCSLPDYLNLMVDYTLDCVHRFQNRESLTPVQQLHYSPALAHQSTRQDVLQLSASNQAQRLPQNFRREQLQGAHACEYGLVDPTLQTSGGLGQHQINIPPPSITPVRNFTEQDVSLNPSLSKKCVVPACRYFGDPDLAMMCSSCFKKYTIKESRQMAAGRTLHRPSPTAPVSSMPGNEERLQLSMMSERCKEKCGYRCSTKTYPYCHECASRRQRQIQEKAMAAASESAMGPDDKMRSLVESSNDPSPVLMCSTYIPAENREAIEKMPLNDLNTAHGSSSASHPSVGGTLSEMPEAGPSLPKNRFPLPEGNKFTESVTQEVVTGGPSSPCSTSQDLNVAVLFGSGHLSTCSSHSGQTAPSETQPQVGASGLVTTTTNLTQFATEQKLGGTALNNEHTQWSHLTPQQHTAAVHEEDLSSASRLVKSQMSSVVSGGAVGETEATCANPGCSELAVHRDLCGKCYMSQDMVTTELASQNAQKMKGMSIHSTSSSAPTSIDPLANIPKSNATYTKETKALNPLESKSLPSSLKDLSVTAPMTHVSCWLVDNRMVEMQNVVVPSGLKNPPEGLPEKQESEPLGSNDLIASGAECCASTQKCIGEGCGNTVQSTEKLCQQCQDILRHARQGHGASASGKDTESQPRQQSCRTEGCSYFGIQQNLGYCSMCYGKHVKRELDEGNRHGNPASTIRSSSSALPVSRSITVPPDFHFVRTPLDLQGEYCKSAGCSLFGDPSQAGMCSAHYQQHQESLARAMHKMPVAGHQSEIIQIPYASEVRISPTSATFFTSEGGILKTMKTTKGGVFPSQQVPALPPPCSSGMEPSMTHQLSLGETYYRVAGRHMGECLNPTCTNYGNRSNGGLCNKCAQDQKVTDDLINRTIYGDEETG